MKASARPKGAESPLAGASDVLSRQVRLHLENLLAFLEPHVSELNRLFRQQLGGRRCDSRRWKALSEITPGAAAALHGQQCPLDNFFEQVEYNGRRLAKLNVPPGDVSRALRRYGRALQRLIGRMAPGERKDLDQARRQLEFAIILSLNNAYYRVRELETRAYYELFHAELESRSLSELRERLLATLVEFCGARSGRLILLEDAAAVPSSARRALRRPRYIEDGRARNLILDPSLLAGCASHWSIPMLDGGKLRGVMQFGFATRYAWLPRELQMLEAAAERCLEAAEKARLVEDLAAREAQVRQLSEHMLRVEEEERRRISRELHDEAGQSMLYIRLRLEMLEQTLAEGSDLRAKAADIRQMTEHTISEIRRVIAALSPAVLEQMGLSAAVRQLANRFRQAYPARVSLAIAPKVGRLPRHLEFITYRLAQECLNNIAKHSHASHVNIHLNSADGFLELNVADDGIGFEVGAALEQHDSFGLAGMRERVALLGGRLEIESGPQRGTRISAALPVRSAGGSGNPDSGTAGRKGR